MIEVFREILDYERDLILRARSQGKFILRPSTIALLLIGVLYLTSAIDIVPEYFIQPKLLGYIDDMIVVVTILIYTYRDWGEIIEGEVQLPRIQRSKSRRQDEDDVPNGSDESLTSADNHTPSGIDSERSDSSDTRIPIDVSSIPSFDSLINSATSEQSRSDGDGEGSLQGGTSGAADDGTDEDEDAGATGLPGSTIFRS